MNRLYFFFVLISLIIVGCKNKNNDTVPTTLVELNLYINNPSYVKLSTVGGWLYVNGGVRGILVYRSSTSEFKAYDRNCTYQSADACATLFVDNTDIMAVDTCCGSQFLIVDGSIIKGPAAVPLKQYNTTFDGSLLHIYN